MDTTNIDTTNIDTTNIDTTNFDTVNIDVLKIERYKRIFTQIKTILPSFSSIIYRIQNIKANYPVTNNTVKYERILCDIRKQF